MNEMTKPEGLLKSPFKDRYDNFIGGKFVAPKNGRYFTNTTPITGAAINEIARSDAADIELALDAAHAAKAKWGSTSPADRARALPRLLGYRRSRDKRHGRLRKACMIIAGGMHDDKSSPRALLAQATPRA